MTFNIINKGVSDAKFLTITVLPSADYEVISPNDMYLGNLDSDDYETAQFKIKLNKIAGKSVNIPIRLEYADINNQRYVDDGQISLRVYSGSELKQISGGNGYIGWIGLIILIVAGFFYYRHRKKNLKK